VTISQASQITESFLVLGRGPLRQSVAEGSMKRPVKWLDTPHDDDFPLDFVLDKIPGPARR
jgi:hypothetical protein